MLEKLLCSNEEPPGSITQSTKSTCQDIPDLEEFVHNFYTGYPNCKEFIVDFYTVTKNTGNNMDEVASDVIQSLDEESNKATSGKREQASRGEESRKRRSVEVGTEREKLNVSSPDGRSNVTCNSSDDGERTVQSDNGERGVLDASLRGDGQSSGDCDFTFDRDVTCENNRTENLVVVPTAPSSCTKLNEIGRDSTVSAVSSRDVQNARGNEENFLTSEITRAFEGSDNIEIPLGTTQYLLNRVSRESTPIVNSEALHTQNSLPDLDSKKLISEANKTLSNLLLDGGECQNEISEQTDSGICTVISSENTSLYDKSPEEKKTFANEIQREEEDDARVSDEEEDAQENTSYSCSNLSSPTKRRNLDAENSCVCGTRSAKTVVTVQHSTDDLHANAEEFDKNIPRISSNFDGTNEEFVGVAYGNGHLTLCDSNQSTFQINYSENWENLNLNIDAPNSRKEFWGDLKCENCPSTSRNIDKMIGSKIERYAQDKKRTTREERQRRRHHHKLDRNSQKVHHGRLMEKRQNLQVVRSTTSTESSR